MPRAKEATTAHAVTFAPGQKGTTMTSTASKTSKTSTIDDAAPRVDVSKVLQDTERDAATLATAETAPMTSADEVRAIVDAVGAISRRRTLAANQGDETAQTLRGLAKAAERTDWLVKARGHEALGRPAMSKYGPILGLAKSQEKALAVHVACGLYLMADPDSPVTVQKVQDGLDGFGMVKAAQSALISTNRKADTIRADAEAEQAKAVEAARVAVATAKAKADEDPDVDVAKVEERATRKAAKAVKDAKAKADAATVKAAKAVRSDAAKAAKAKRDAAPLSKAEAERVIAALGKATARAEANGMAADVTGFAEAIGEALTKASAAKVAA